MASGAVISSCCGANSKLLRSLLSVFSVPLTVNSLQFAVVQLFRFQFSSVFPVPFSVHDFLFSI